MYQLHADQITDLRIHIDHIVIEFVLFIVMQFGAGFIGQRPKERTIEKDQITQIEFEVPILDFRMPNVGWFRSVQINLVDGYSLCVGLLKILDF